MKFGAAGSGRSVPGATPVGRLQGDAALIARLRAGDESAYRELVPRYHKAMLVLARTVLRNFASAEEVVQETWLAVVTHIGAFEGRARLSTWMFEILLNKARSRAIRDGRWIGFTDLIGPLHDDGDSSDDPTCFLLNGHWAKPVGSWDQLDPERIVAGRQLWAHVERALEDLPAGQRAVVVLRDVDGLAFCEIGGLLGLTPANVRVLLHRGRSRLRRAIEMLQESAASDQAGVNGPAAPSRNEKPIAGSDGVRPPS